jgi:hypothetical protein
LGWRGQVVVLFIVIIAAVVIAALRYDLNSMANLVIAIMAVAELMERFLSVPLARYRPAMDTH